MRIAFVGAGLDTEVEIAAGSTIKDALKVARIHPSTVLVSNEDVVIPHSTKLNADITLDLTVVSSGG